MNRIRSQLTYANFVSTLCLFLLLGGGAYAALKPAKNSVGTKQLKNNAVKGPKVANRSLSAVDIGGSVDSARSADEADHAADSGLLGGQAPASFFPSAQVKTADAQVFEPSGSGGSEVGLLTMGPLTLTMSCGNVFDEQTIGIKGTSSAADASIGWGFSLRDVATGTAAEANVSPLSSVQSLLVVQTTQVSQEGAGELVYRDANRTIAIPFRYLVNESNGECLVSGVALQS